MKKTITLLLFSVLLFSCEKDENLYTTSELSTDNQLKSIIIDEIPYDYALKQNKTTNKYEVVESENKIFIERFFAENPNACMYIDQKEDKVMYFSTYEAMMKYAGITPEDIEGNNMNKILQQENNIESGVSQGYPTNVKMYEHLNYGGIVKEFHDIGVINNFESISFNDMLTSFKATCIYSNLDLVVSFYEDSYRNGHVITFRTYNGYSQDSNFTTWEFGWPFTKDWNDRVSSIHTYLVGN